LVLLQEPLAAWGLHPVRVPEGHKLRLLLGLLLGHRLQVLQVLQVLQERAGLAGRGCKVS